MKKQIFPLLKMILIAFVFGTSTLDAQTTPKRYALTIHPVSSLWIGGMNISIEGPLSKDLWAYEIPLYLGYNDYIGNSPLLITGIGFGVRRYLFENGSGSYVSPQIDLVNIYSSVSENRSNGSADALLMMSSLRWGYKACWDFFTLDVGLGFQYLKPFLLAGNGKGIGNDFDDHGSILSPSFNFAFGAPF